ncbi:MAG: hypothetical protein ACRD26_11055 [Vicinamibacterales bacterium]
MPLGDVGDDDPPPQAENSVASVAPEATWQAPAQNRRRETGAFVSDIAIFVRGRPVPGGQYQGHSQTTRFFLNQQSLAVPLITDCGEDGRFRKRNRRAHFCRGRRGIDSQKTRTTHQPFCEYGALRAFSSSA